MAQQSQASIARSDYSGLKAAIHRRLIQKLDLDRLNQLKREDVRREVGELLHLANLDRFVARKRAARRPFHRLFFRFHLNHPVAADDLLCLSEGPVDHLGLP